MKLLDKDFFEKYLRRDNINLWRYDFNEKTNVLNFALNISITLSFEIHLRPPINLISLLRIRNKYGSVIFEGGNILLPNQENMDVDYIIWLYELYSHNVQKPEMMHFTRMGNTYNTMSHDGGFYAAAIGGLMLEYSFNSLTKDIKKVSDYVHPLYEELICDLTFLDEKYHLKAYGLNEVVPTTVEGLVNFTIKGEITYTPKKYTYERVGFEIYGIRSQQRLELVEVYIISPKGYEFSSYDEISEKVSRQEMLDDCKGFIDKLKV